MRRLSVFFLILPLFFSGCKMSSASQANITLTVSAISIEKSDDGIILTLEMFYTLEFFSRFLGVCSDCLAILWEFSLYYAIFSR